MFVMDFKEDYLITLSNEKLNDLGYHQKLIFKIGNQNVAEEKIEIINCISEWKTHNVSKSDIKPIEIDSELAKNITLDCVIAANYIRQGDEIPTTTRPKNYFLDELKEHHSDIDVLSVKYIHEVQELLRTYNRSRIWLRPY